MKRRFTVESKETEKRKDLSNLNGKKVSVAASRKRGECGRKLRERGNRTS